jgi:YesN/AraC family two-component response regulator
MPSPALVDVEAAYVFACTCQDSLGVFAGGDDTLQLLDTVHRALGACPDALSAIYMGRSAMAVAGLGRQVLCHIATIQVDDGQTMLSTPDRVRSALRRVLAWHHEPALKLNRIADSLSLSVQYLSESIHRISHRGFLDHLHAIRVLHAAVALIETQESVHSITRRVGYLTAPHLTRQFHRVLHVTPARFRTVAFARPTKA